jgi:hypothetical protein
MSASGVVCKFAELSTIVPYQIFWELELGYLLVYILDQLKV